MVKIPTLQQLYNDILTDLQTGYSITIPVFGKSFLRVQAAVQAGKMKLYYLAVGLLQKNIFVDTADPEAAGGTLERFGRVKIGRNPYPATQGQYEVGVTGVFGGIIPGQTTWLSDDSSLNPGMLFILDNSHTLTGTTDIITVRALTPGTGSKLMAGDTLTATAPIINVDGGAGVVTETIAPVDAESIEDYRKVVIDSYRLYPQGGAPADYRLWGNDAEGVKQVYPYAASAAPNEINVFVEANISDSTDGMGTPTPTILADVEDVINTDPITGIGRKPLGVFSINVLPIIVNKIAIQITGFTGVTVDQQALIEQALSEGISAIRPFVAGADVLSERNDYLGINNIINIILNTVPGSVFTSVNMTVQIGAETPVPTASKNFDFGNIPFLTSVSYA